MRSVAMLVISILFFSVSTVVGQRKEVITQYIAQFESLAIAEMQRTGVPASIKLAQGIHETQAGTSTLVQRSNNHFGIKCKTGWSGPSVRHDDDERSECFRKYESAEASFVDHSNFLKNSPRYFSLFNISPTDYQAWAWGLKKAGYATNPQYAQTLIKLIEEYDLNKYTLLAMGKSAPPTNTESAGLSDKAEPDVVTSSTVSSGIKTIESKTLANKKSDLENAPAEKVNSRKEEATYPSGVFEQDGCRAVWVRAGTPFLQIADQYQIPLAKLFAYNQMDPILEASRDQVILLERRAATAVRWPLRNKRSR